MNLPLLSSFLSGWWWISFRPPLAWDLSSPTNGSTFDGPWHPPLSFPFLSIGRWDRGEKERGWFSFLSLIPPIHPHRHRLTETCHPRYTTCAATFVPSSPWKEDVPRRAWGRRKRRTIGEKVTTIASVIVRCRIGPTPETRGSTSKVPERRDKTTTTSVGHASRAWRR